MLPPIRIAGGQGFYGDSPMGAIAIAKEKAADYIIIDSLAELTLSILQKDRMKDPSLGYARDIELMATTLIPIALKNGIKIVTNSGGLNPLSAAQKLSAALVKQGIKGVKIATVTGDDFLSRLNELQKNGESLNNLDTNFPFSSVSYAPIQSNVYIGSASVTKALDEGAQIILAGRVADPCLTLGVLVHEFNWKLQGNVLTQNDWDKLACGISIGHLLECGGQASGGNSYGEWPMDYNISNLGYPIAHVQEDGTAIFTKLENAGGKMSRNTLREQLIYEIHDPSHYITPDVIVDLTNVKIEDLAPNKVSFSGAKGKVRPEKLKLTIGLMEGYSTEQFFFFSWPYAYQKAQKFVEGVKGIWSKLPIKIERFEHQFIGLNGIHESAAPMPDEETINGMNEIGVRLIIKHQDEKAGKMAMQSVVCLALNGPPGLISMPGWGNVSKAMLSLWPTLIDRRWVNEEVNIFET
jgi:hypothetical protein